MSETHVDEVADRIYRVSTFLDDAGLCFNQYLVDADEPLLFHTGHRALFGEVSAAVASVVPLERLRWISFGHLEADECGSMNEWLAAAPNAQVAGNQIGTLVSLADMCDRPPRPLADGEVVDLGGKRVRNLDTPHVPHGWDAHLLYEETTGTLFCGDLFTATGPSPATTTDDVVGPAIAAEDLFGASCITPATGPTIRGLRELAPATLALMHGPAFTGDTVAALAALGDDYERRLTEVIEGRS
ncbi:MAG TPA: MBL fold metallo-hydrolase [Acidimicrobiia bacterium]